MFVIMYIINFALTWIQKKKKNLHFNQNSPAKGIGCCLEMSPNIEYDNCFETIELYRNKC